MDAWVEFLLFFAKALVFFIAFVGVILVIVAASLKIKNKPQLEIENINENLKQTRDLLREVAYDKNHLKEIYKSEKKLAKEVSEKKRPRCFYLIFEGDIKASQVKELREEITALLSVAEKGDEVLLSLESPGGVVHGYGLAAAELVRIKEAQYPLSVCVDKVAASGGYMMACVAHKIYAAPFAILGSIGVLAQVPNLHRLLKKNEIDYEEMTAGEYKKTVSIFGEITEKGKERFKEQLHDTHELFKAWIQTHRPQLDIQKVATGEYWFALRAKDLGLIDEIKTSDDVLLEKMKTHDVLKIKIHAKKKLAEKLSESLSILTEKWADRIATRLNAPPHS